MKLDTWQKEVLEEKGNIVLRSGRQVGKSTVISQKASHFALDNEKNVVLVIAAVERQAYYIFMMIINYLKDNFPDKIKGNPTMTFLELENGSMIRCLPAGDTGYSIRGYTVNMLIADEAAFINDLVWQAVTPMLATTKGTQILLSTPFGKDNYFARCFKDDNFKKFHVSSEDCERIDENFLKNEKKRMTKLQYAQEYLGQFVDELMQFFPDKLIEKCQILKRTGATSGKDYFLGVDVARMGNDETTFEVIDRTNRKNLIHCENIVKTNILTTHTAREIVNLNKRWSFKKIYVDSGGMGIGVVDMLRDNDDTKRKVVEINNASRSIERDTNRKKGILKEDLYNNLLNLMEKREIKLLDDNEIFQSLKSVQYEYVEGGRLKIFGRYTHIVEGLIRAAWCLKDKTLNIYIC